MSNSPALQRHLARQAHEPEPATADDRQAFRRALWHQGGVAVIDPDSIADPWQRQIVINLANERYGRRKDA